MVNQPNQNFTYLFGVFSDTTDSVALETAVARYQDQTSAFTTITQLLVVAILDKIAVSLSASDLDKLLSLFEQKASKDKVRQWLDTKIPNATLLLTETVELSLFGLAELHL